MNEGKDAPWPPPMWVGWLLVLGAPVIVFVSWVFYREDGLFSVVLNGWYAVVSLGFGIVCLRAARRQGALADPSPSKSAVE
jgi:hypothetical protein